MNRKLLIIVLVTILAFVVTGLLAYSFVAKPPKAPEVTSNVDKKDIDYKETRESDQEHILTVKSPKRGSNLTLDSKIEVSTNVADAQILMIVESDKWGKVFSAEEEGPSAITYFSPIKPLASGESGSLIVRLARNGKTIREERIWVNF